MTRRTLRLTALLLAAAAVASSCSGKDTNDDDASSATTAAPCGAGDHGGGRQHRRRPAKRRPRRLRRRRPPRPARRPRRRRRPARSTRSRGPPTARSTRSTRSTPSTIRRTRSSTRCASRCCGSSPTASIAPGITTLTRPDDVTMVFTVRDGVTFWDGSPLTADDIVFSLQREMDPTLGGFYGARLRSGGVDQGHRAERGDDRALAARLLPRGRAGVDARHHRVEGVRRGAGRGVRHARRRNDVHRAVPVRLVERRRPPHGHQIRRLLERGAPRSPRSTSSACPTRTR